MNTSSSPPKVDVIYVSPLSLWRRSVCQTLSEASLISSATARVAPSLLKVSAILSGTTVRRAAVEREDLKLNCKSGKRSHFPKWSTYLLFTSFSKVLLRPFPNIPKYRDHRWDLPTIMKLRFMRKFKIHPVGSCEKLQLIYIWKFKLAILQNHHWNTIRTRRLWRIKVGYYLRNQLGIYGSIMLFQIISRRDKQVKRYLSHQD